MKERLLLDTHIVVRWLTDDRRLSKEQIRVLERSEHNGEPLAISAITLMELGLLVHAGPSRLRAGAVVLDELEQNGVFSILPVTIAIAREIASVIPVLRDPMDATIAATARVHGLRLVTSDQRILDANVVSTVA